MDELEARIEALERAVTDGDRDLSELATEGETRERLAALEDDLDNLADRVAELEAATQALRGYVGNVRAVNSEVEQRADAALATAESLESELAALRSREPSGTETAPDGPAAPSRQGADTRSSSDERIEAGNHERGNHAHEHGDHAHERGERCQACGRPARGPETHDSGRATTDADQLDAVFESEPENGDGGTFDRIREML